MQNLPILPPLELAALLASRICHDVISPVGALANGLEVLDEDQAGEMRDFAMELINNSAKSAAARLKFSRLAFGASGSSSAAIDTGDAEEVVGLYMAGEKAQLTWSGERSIMPKNKVKLLLNLVLIALGAIPRGGFIKVFIDGQGDTATFSLRCTGVKARVPPDYSRMLLGEFDQEVTAHVVQPYYTILLAQETGLDLSASMDGDDVVLTAR